jgi:hypothetical protein
MSDPGRILGAMAERRERTAITLVPVAALAGAVAGHWLTYAATFSNAASRRAILAQTGHGYWSFAVEIAIACGALAAANTIVRHIARGLRHERPIGPYERFGLLASRLATLQATVFVVQEALERVHAGAPVSGLARDGFVAVGIMMQVLVAVISAVILAWLGRTAEALARACARPRSVSGAAVARSVLALLLPDPADGRAVRTRAPPSVLPVSA